MCSEMEKLSDFLEFGTRNYKTIELQKFGFSRELSIYIQKKHSDCLSFSAGDLDNIDFDKLFKDFDQNNVLYEELKEYKYIINSN